MSKAETAAMKLEPRKECGARDIGSYGADYPCHLPQGHKGSHECLDKDECPHHWDKPKEFVQTPWDFRRRP